MEEDEPTGFGRRMLWGAEKKRLAGGEGERVENRVIIKEWTEKKDSRMVTSRLKSGPWMIV
jgi:hypothetical protein